MGMYHSVPLMTVTSHCWITWALPVRKRFTVVEISRISCAWEKSVAAIRAMATDASFLIGVCFHKYIFFFGKLPLHKAQMGVVMPPEVKNSEF